MTDPVGFSPLDPAGVGHRGKTAIADFYDKFISLGKVSFDYPRSYACDKVDSEAKILSLHAFWEFERAQLAGDLHPPVGDER